MKKKIEKTLVVNRLMKPKLKRMFCLHVFRRLKHNNIKKCFKCGELKFPKERYTKYCDCKKRPIEDISPCVNCGGMVCYC